MSPHLGVRQEAFLLWKEEKMLSSFHLHLKHVLASRFMQSIVPLFGTNIYTSNFLVLLSKDPSLSVAWQHSLTTGHPFWEVRFQVPKSLTQQFLWNLQPFGHSHHVLGARVSLDWPPLPALQAFPSGVAGQDRTCWEIVRRELCQVQRLVVGLLGFPLSSVLSNSKWPTQKSKERINKV